MMDVALTLRPSLSLRTAWGFRVCERERECWAERFVLLLNAREPGFWSMSHLPTRISIPWRKQRST